MTLDHDRGGMNIPPLRRVSVGVDVDTFTTVNGVEIHTANSDSGQAQVEFGEGSSHFTLHLSGSIEGIEELGDAILAVAAQLDKQRAERICVEFNAAMAEVGA